MKLSSILMIPCLLYIYCMTQSVEAKPVPGPISAKEAVELTKKGEATTVTLLFNEYLDQCFRGIRNAAATGHTSVDVLSSVGDAELEDKILTRTSEKLVSLGYAVSRRTGALHVSWK